MTEQRKLLSEDQMAVMAEVWARPMIKPRYVQGECVKCGHMGSLNAETGLCMWPGNHRDDRA